MLVLAAKGSVKRMNRRLDEEKIRVIKIGRQALFEFVYENFIAEQGAFFDVDPLAVTGTFDMNFERGEFVFCVYKSEDKQGRAIRLPEETDLQQLMKNIPDTTASMFAANRYVELTRDEFAALSGAQQVSDQEEALQ